ncbi:MAG TPA: aminotransferase class III-fold pyridoxal phosphate-dependent enzyme, partial [Planctomycetota bacterium]|nr:aminotransferase class III-fold pyridoxal phosphate-dependent enzyme [Planctomycetota bacterium]
LQPKFGIIADVRGKGSLIGVELKESGTEFVKRCMQAGLLLNCTHDKVIRFYPALNVKEEQIDECVEIARKCL